MNKNKATYLPRPQRKLMAVAIAALCASPAFAAGDFNALGDLGGGQSWGYGVSGDGSVVVGSARLPAPGGQQAFRWAGGNMQSIGHLGAGYSEGFGVSADGSTIVGHSTTAANFTHAFRWTQAGGMQDLGTLGGMVSVAYAASADGSVVVGHSGIGAEDRAFRWTQGGGMQSIGTLGGADSYAYGVSANGQVVVGASKVTPGFVNMHAYRWTPGGGMQDLGTFGGQDSWARAVSQDGEVVVGEATIISGEAHAFRWTQAGGIVDLGTLGGLTSGAFGVSADGSVVVGSSRVANAAGYRAFRWTAAGGMQPVSAWLAASGVALPAGYVLRDAKGVSADGSVIVGTAMNAASLPEAYLARVVAAPPPGGGNPGQNANSGIGSGIINPTRFNVSVAEAASRAAQAGNELPNLALFGAHHRSLLDSGLARSADGACAWATADHGEFNASDNRATLAEVGACKDFGSVRIGLGVGQAWSKQKWSLGGKAEYNGQYLIAEIANDFGNGIEGSLTGYHGRFDTDFRRHYMNGANVASSRGDSDAVSSALRARVDWKDALQAASFSFSPYAAYTHIRTRLDGYTETGGGFPVAYSASKWKTDDVRVGVAARTEIGPATQLRLAGELVHRFDDSTDGVKGQVLGLWAFNLDGEKVKQNWTRATLDIDHKLSENGVLTAGANLATQGGDPSWGVTLGYRAAF
jgi:probable HAF family extracellular repeat protein